MAVAAAEEGDMHRSARLLGAARSLRLGNDGPDTPDIELLAARVLSDAQLVNMQTEAGAMTHADVVAMAEAEVAVGRA